MNAIIGKECAPFLFYPYPLVALFLVTKNAVNAFINHYSLLLIHPIRLLSAHSNGPEYGKFFPFEWQEVCLSYPRAVVPNRGSQ